MQRHFATLAIGDTLTIKEDGQNYELHVVEVKPNTSEGAICVIDTDLAVDFSAAAIGGSQTIPVLSPTRAAAAVATADNNRRAAARAARAAVMAEATQSDPPAPNQQQKPLPTSHRPPTEIETAIAEQQAAVSGLLDAHRDRTRSAGLLGKSPDPTACCIQTSLSGNQSSANNLATNHTRESACDDEALQRAIAASLQEGPSEAAADDDAALAAAIAASLEDSTGRLSVSEQQPHHKHQANQIPHASMLSHSSAQRVVAADEARAAQRAGNDRAADSGKDTPQAGPEPSLATHNTTESEASSSSGVAITHASDIVGGESASGSTNAPSQPDAAELRRLRLARFG